MDIVCEKEPLNTHVPCAVVELRQYTLHPGRRDELIGLFEREFVESQECCGLRLLGLFRDLDDPDRFVWLRGFSDMPSRAAALAAFYGGPVWQAHREAANATMIDSDDVLLLRPARSDSGFADGDDAAAPEDPLIVAMIWQLPVRVGADFLPWFERRTLPVLRAAGARLLASFVSEHASNTFPALPVREGENVFACFLAFKDSAAWDRHFGGIAHTGNSHDARRNPSSDPLILRLAPTARSRVRG
ncbi:MAG: NIPSNAP family protein [Dokdonella sp.]